MIHSIPMPPTRDEIIPMDVVQVIAGQIQGEVYAPAIPEPILAYVPPPVAWRRPISNAYDRDSLRAWARRMKGIIGF